MANAKRDDNFERTLIGVSSDDGVTPTLLEVDPITGRLLVDITGSFAKQVDDTAHSSGDDGTMMLAVRKDAGGTFVDTDGDYSPLQVDANGALVVTGGGGGTEYSEDAATPATIVGTASLMERDDVIATLTPVEGDWVGMRATAEGALWVQDFNSDAILAAVDGIEGLLAGTITIAGAVTVSGVATAANQTTIIGHLDGVETLLTAIDGRVDGVEALLTTIDADTGSILLAVDGIEALLGTIDADTGGMVVSLALMDDWDNAASDGASVSGDVAHDAADAGEPVKIGGRAQAPTADLEEVADNDRVDAAFDRQGRLATWMGYPVQSAVINTSTSGDNTIVAAAGAGKRIAVLGCVIVSDGTTDVRWEDGASGTAKTGQIPLQVREGFVMPIGPQPWFVGAANTLLNLELTAAINVHGIVSYIVMED